MFIALSTLKRIATDRIAVPGMRDDTMGLNRNRYPLFLSSHRPRQFVRASDKSTLMHPAS